MGNIKSRTPFGHYKPPQHVQRCPNQISLGNSVLVNSAWKINDILFIWCLWLLYNLLGNVFFLSPVYSIYSQKSMQTYTNIVYSLWIRLMHLLHIKNIHNCNCKFVNLFSFERSPRFTVMWILSWGGSAYKEQVSPLVIAHFLKQKYLLTDNDKMLGCIFNHKVFLTPWHFNKGQFV